MHGFGGRAKLYAYRRDVDRPLRSPGHAGIVSQRDYFAGPAQVRVVRLDGSLDRSYRGTAAFETGGEGHERLPAAQQPDGRLVLVGGRPASGESGGARLDILAVRRSSWRCALSVPYAYKAQRKRRRPASGKMRGWLTLGVSLTG
jgi:hypothetical protein